MMKGEDRGRGVAVGARVEYRLCFEMRAMNDMSGDQKQYLTLDSFTVASVLITITDVMTATVRKLVSLI